MRILVVLKSTNYELHADELRLAISKNYLSKTELNKLDLENKEYVNTCKFIFKSLTDNKLDFDVINCKDVWPIDNKYTLIMTVGGDGTFLSAAQHCDEQQLIVGIRATETSVGYLCGVDANIRDDFTKLIVDIKSNNFPELNLQRLQAKITHIKSDKISIIKPALNEYLFCHAYHAGTARYRITFQSQFEDQKSSGVWIATAAGSSGAVLSAGGKAVAPNKNISQFLVREPYNVRSLKLVKSEFSAGKDKLEILCLMSEGLLAVDGLHSVTTLEYGDKIEFYDASPLRTINYKNYDS